ncbi:hypothetical protein K505DRAFT_13252 [Melanomma pulvis-pyrius CBS 109.77]|uniref:Uncharacterized protein n=1 Tax=Melanomma pulvis-pyrius CBS 109.77 TaxID=1314802 RepID=A0A6A6XHQ9_9PLEO|nr:hypothetical protein K505DRAFT_13252 [Melanomma pulvis-pyrius CBS 109.77]
MCCIADQRPVYARRGGVVLRENLGRVTHRSCARDFFGETLAPWRFDPASRSSLRSFTHNKLRHSLTLRRRPDSRRPLQHISSLSRAPAPSPRPSGERWMGPCCCWRPCFPLLFQGLRVFATFHLTTSPSPHITAATSPLFRDTTNHKGCISSFHHKDRKVKV